MLHIRVGVGRLALEGKEPKGGGGGAAQQDVTKATSQAAPQSASLANVTPPMAPQAKAAAEEKDELDPSKLEIKVGLVVKCWNHGDSEKLLCEEIDLGGETRQIASGLRPHYTAEQLQGRKVLVLCNLKARKIGGFESNGMVLCACSDDHSVVKLLEPPQDAPVGERVMFAGFSGSEPATPSQMAKKKILEALAPGLRTDGEGKAKWGEAAYFTFESNAGSFVKADALLPNAPIS